jgi:hypothetical protein
MSSGVVQAPPATALTQEQLTDAVMRSGLLVPVGSMPSVRWAVTAVNPAAPARFLLQNQVLWNFDKAMLSDTQAGNFPGSRVGRSSVPRPRAQVTDAPEE